MRTSFAPSLSFSFYSHSSSYFLPVSPSKYFNSVLHHQHTKVFTLKPYLYSTYSFEVGILYLLSSLGARFASPLVKSSPYNKKHCVSQGHTETVKCFNHPLFE